MVLYQFGWFSGQTNPPSNIDILSLASNILFPYHFVCEPSWWWQPRLDFDFDWNSIVSHIIFYECRLLVQFWCSYSTVPLNVIVTQVCLGYKKKAYKWEFCLQCFLNCTSQYPYLNICKIKWEFCLQCFLNGIQH